MLNDKLVDNFDKVFNVCKLRVRDDLQHTVLLVDDLLQMLKPLHQYCTKHTEL